MKLHIAERTLLNVKENIIEFPLKQSHLTGYLATQRISSNERTPSLARTIHLCRPTCTEHNMKQASFIICESLLLLHLTVII